MPVAPAPTLRCVKGTIVMYLVDGAGESTANGSYTKSGKADGIDSTQGNTDGEIDNAGIT